MKKIIAALLLTVLSPNLFAKVSDCKLARAIYLESKSVVEELNKRTRANPTYSSAVEIWTQVEMLPRIHGYGRALGDRYAVLRDENFSYNFAFLFLSRFTQNFLVVDGKYSFDNAVARKGFSRISQSYSTILANFCKFEDKSPYRRSRTSATSSK